MHRFLIFVGLLSAAGAWASPCKSISPIDPGQYAAAQGNRTMVFVLADLKSGACQATDGAAIKSRHAPWSTFKIPHSLIALETGALTSAKDRIEWDPARHKAETFWPKDWAQTQTLETAFERSTAWAYQELVPRIGAGGYRQWLGRFQYGNQAFSIENREFWLGGSLQISPLEQIAFLGCLAKDGCGVRKDTLAIFEDIALEREAGGKRLYAKTGSGPLKAGDYDGAFGGWFVGYVRGEGGVPEAAFALYAEGENFSSLRTFRREMSLHLLQSLGKWPK